ncbi:MAG: hypothetical protein DRP94_05355 [Candidatus Latescibacterota bacterium]|nr:MAG: hypothetical protein DRP94_05355 [Candidatus Latescibacterota bacterium]RKY74446.1 MAG: hypothetical protein DRQ14_02060 [Candidatus Latescibacterota bacterium]
MRFDPLPRQEEGETNRPIVKWDDSRTLFPMKFTLTYLVYPPAVEEEEARTVPEHFGIVRAYPNPASERISFLLGLPRREELKVRVYNILGQKVFDGGLGGVGRGMYRLDMELGGLGDGFYFIEVVGSGGSRSVGRFLKLGGRGPGGMSLRLTEVGDVGMRLRKVAYRGRLAPSGVYVVRTRTGEGGYVRKVSLVR